MGFLSKGAVMRAGLLCFPVFAQKIDPIENMCVRFDHQSVIKNNTLFIDGGRQTFADNPKASKNLYNITQGYNEYLVAIDLSKSWDWKTNISETALVKAKLPGTDRNPPVFSRGALYHGPDSDNNIYLWGGTTSYYNTSFPGFQSSFPANQSLWSYNIATSVWTSYNMSFASGITNRPTSGSYTEAPDQNLGFYFNGYLDSGSSTETQDLGTNRKFPVEGMIVVYTNNQTTRNVSTRAVVSNMPRSRGQMQYIGTIGEKGILVQIGGNQTPLNQIINKTTDNLVPLNQIDVFDVSSLYSSATPDGVWYKQNTSGETPESRIDFCLVEASSEDNSIQNIYMYGGRGADETFLDDVWVLSLPSFTWTKIYEGSSPRYGHTCHHANDRTMLTVGGARNSEYTQGPCDWERKGVGVFDMSAATWGSKFSVDSSSPYTIPQAVASSIADASKKGGGVRQQPLGGFNQKGLAELFTTEKGSNGNFSSSSNVDSSGAVKPSTIIGAVIGGVAVLGFVWSLLFCYRRRLLHWWQEKEFPYIEMGAVEKAKARADKMDRDACWELPTNEKPVEMPCPEQDAPRAELKGSTGWVFEMGTGSDDGEAVRSPRQAPSSKQLEKYNAWARERRLELGVDEDIPESMKIHSARPGWI